MASPSIARKRHLVTLANAGPRVSDGEGGYTETWLPLTPPTWNVAIETPSPSGERVTGQGVQASVRHVVRGDYRPDVSTATVITRPGTQGRPDRRFYVRGVENPDEANGELLLDCEEAVGKPAVMPAGARS
jgi:hypothetical protein